MIGEPYQTLEQQHETAEFGMWIFLATELMLFGGLFTAYTVYRSVYPDGFLEGSQHLDLVYGGVNTAILLVSTLTMALAVQAAQRARRRGLVWYLVATAALGLAFMVIKGAEYYQHYVEGTVPGLNWTYAGQNANSVQLFFVAYFTMTGLHSVHLIVAIILVGVLAFRLPRHDTSVQTAAGGISQRDPSVARPGLGLPLRATSVEMVGLYWHFVDIVWTFLFPLLYLLGAGR